MTKQELAQKIKAKYPQYKNIEDNELADKIISKYPVYQSQITETKPSLSGLKENLSQRGEQFKETFEQTASGEINPLQTGVRTVGTAIGGAGDVLFQVIKEGVKAISPKTVEAIKGGVSKVGESDLVQNISEKYSDWATRNPEQAKDLEATLNIASIIPIGKAGQVVSKSVGQVAQKTGTALKSAATKVKPAIGSALSTTGAVGEKAGKSLVSASLSPTMEQAGRIITYKSKTPLLTRLQQAARGVEKAPVTPADVAIKYNLASLSRSQIGIKAKRVANDLFNNQVKPALNSIKEKVSKQELFNSVKKEIEKIKDISTRKAQLNALESLADDYKNVSSWSYKTLDTIKSEMAKRLPSKVWKGQDIAGDLNNVRKILSDKARNVIRKKLPKEITTIYDEYGSLKELSERGAKALTSGLNTNLIGLTGEAMRIATTPITTLGGSAISKAGTAVRKLGNRLLKSKPLPKTKGEILKSTQKLDSLNPTGSVFAKYTPKQRATAELADNITTLDKTMGKSADEMITVYRGSSNGGEIVPGDFITTNKQLAKDYAGTGKVLEKKVKLSDILDDITEPLGEEYIYRPKTKLKSTPLVSKTEQSLIKEAKKIMEKEGKPHRFDLSDDEFLKKVFLTKEEAAQNIVDNYKKNNRQMLTNRIKDAHSAPGLDDYTIKDVISGKSNQPKDILTLEGLKKYGNESFYGNETIKAINQAQKTGKIKIYRAVPKNVNKIESDDWVYLVKEQATTHGKNRLDGDYKILSKEVNIDDIRWDGNDIREWGYSPKSK